MAGRAGRASTPTGAAPFDAGPPFTAPASAAVRRPAPFLRNADGSRSTIRSAAVRRTGAGGSTGTRGAGSSAGAGREGAAARAGPSSNQNGRASSGGAGTEIRAGRWSQVAAQSTSPPASQVSVSASRRGGASPRSTATASAASATTAANRWVRASRPTWSVYVARAMSVLSARWSATRRRYCASAAGPDADSTRRQGPDAGDAGSGGGDCTTTWALVPPKPNELTPATRSPVHGTSWSSTVNGVPSSRRYGLRRCWCSVRGSRSCRRLSSTLSSPAMPAAASRWPMFVFTVPTAIVASTPSNAFFSPSISIGSPSRVPVPWASM